MKKKHSKNLRTDERGIATIVISLLIILLLTLIVLAMSRNANREQRQALDRQLNSQAFYAAESGVNDTIKYASTADALEVKDNCGKVDGVGAGDGEIYPGIKNIIDTTGPISYSCVMYDKTPSSLSKDVGTNESWIIPIQAKSGGVDKLTFSWSAKESSTEDNFSKCSNDNKTIHLKSSEYTNQHCKAGYLRVELINPTSPNRDDLIAQDMVVFLAPGQPQETITREDNVGTKAGKNYTAKCDDTSGKCTATINGIGLTQPTQKLYLRLKSIYKPNNVEVTGHYTPAGGTESSVQFANAQIMIDSTGKANDILKRIKVFVPVNAQAGYKYPEFAIQTNDKICKLLDVTGVGDTPVYDHCQ